MFTIEDLRPGDDEAAFALGRQAFGGTDTFDPERPAMAPGRRVGAYRGDTLVGQVRRHGFGQWFGGRLLPCAGISSVMVAPEARGEGLSRRMLAETMARAVDAGEVVAALFPTTAALYRSLGFEVAGWWTVHGVPVGELPAREPAVTWQRAELGDSRAVAVYERMAPDHDGWVVPDPDFWRWRAMAHSRDERTNRWLYLGHRDGEVVAAVQYAYERSDRALYRIDVEALHGVDGPAVRAALGFLGTNGTTADSVRTVLPAAELGVHLAHVQRTAVHETWPWMLAFVDLAGAVAARGYPEAVAGQVPLEVHDAHRPANAGRWVLEVADGRATLAPGGDGRVAVTVTDLAAVFTGHLEPLALARAGRLGAPTTTDLGLLRAAFAGSPSLAVFF